MAKVKKAYFCSACGYEAPKWLGKCPAAPLTQCCNAYIM